MGSGGFLLIILAFGFLYLVLIRPQRRRQSEAQRLLSGLEVGDEIVTAGGLFGEIIELHDDELLLEIAPSVRVRVARRAVGGVVPPAAEDEVETEEAAEPEHFPTAEDGG